MNGKFRERQTGNNLRAFEAFQMEMSTWNIHQVRNWALFNNPLFEFHTMSDRNLFPNIQKHSKRNKNRTKSIMTSEKLRKSETRSHENRADFKAKNRLETRSDRKTKPQATQNRYYEYKYPSK